ncbi:hypothetical protein M409DRAFT_24264 [Zasmidium cellare ATCC 36951]|uniref:SnoaL-like domain-containing protein n=1 Tax=Zasmidium cellare ATCC 36951 TaxID=1080233 RepID=A0A6A6CDY1_ZASCE|nr:uncharacterized protein M409DRAFT_24264 [Zasmidium cellare ATCC 36951]KAF2165414.1 hypothetical protein M409DRAFT_24264 [Zasmidium cellare ATCC 36951]
MAAELRSSSQPYHLTANVHDPATDEALDKAVAKQVESLVQAFLQAINARHFDISNPIYRHKSASFRANAEHFSSRELTLPEYLLAFRELTIDHPQHHANPLDMTTYVDRELGHAKVFVNVEVTGCPVGIVRKSVAVVEFQLEGKEWKCFKRPLSKLQYM